MWLNKTGVHVLARYLMGLPEESAEAAGVRAAFAMLVEYSRYDHLTITDEGLDAGLIAAIEASARPHKVAELLATDFGWHLSQDCFARMFAGAWESVPTLHVAWKLGQAAFERRRFGKSFVVPTELAMRLLASSDPEHRVIGLKVLPSTARDTAECMEVIVDFLKSNQATDVWTALFVLDFEWIEPGLLDAIPVTSRAALGAALDDRARSSDDPYVRTTAQRLRDKLQGR